MPTPFRIDIVLANGTNVGTLTLAGDANFNGFSNNVTFLGYGNAFTANKAFENLNVTQADAGAGENVINGVCSALTLNISNGLYLTSNMTSYAGYIMNVSGGKLKMNCSQGTELSTDITSSTMTLSGGEIEINGNVNTRLWQVTGGTLRMNNCILRDYIPLSYPIDDAYHYMIKQTGGTIIMDGVSFKRHLSA